MNKVKHSLLFILIFISLLLTFVSIGNHDDKESKILLCLGDSITESKWGNYPTMLNKIFQKNGVHITAISLGRPGNTSGEYLKYFKKSNILKKYMPDYIIIMLGTNDVRVDSDNTPTREFKKNISKIIEIIRDFERKAGKKVIINLATIPPLFTPSLETFTKNSAKRIEEEIVPAIKKIANEYQIGIIDIHSMFLKNRDLLPGVHPSPGGYYKIAKEVFISLSPSDYHSGIREE